MNPMDKLVSKQTGATRSSLACLPCRSRHLKCDGRKPCCTRCDEAAKQCHYAQSRRGGLDRTALAQRRKLLTAAKTVSSIDSPVQDLRTQILVGTPLGPDQDHTYHLPEVNIQDGHSLLDGVGDFDRSSTNESPAAPLAHVPSIEDDSLIGSYYKKFHKFHPLVLPRKHLTIIFQNPTRQAILGPLIAVLRFVGHVCDSGEWSAPLDNFVKACISQASQTDPIMVQCRLIYSIVLFWHGYSIESKLQMDAAVRLALDLEMYRHEFAIKHGDGDPVLTECWKRTWWMLYVTEAYYAGTLGTMNFSVMIIDATVELPCEESEYESGKIPQSRTLLDFDNREFAIADISFSSFAYLISAIRCAALAISTVPETVTKETSMHIIHAADSIVDGWLLLLPKDSKQVMSRTGEIDELMFQAHLVVHVSIIGLHRPLSDLKFSAVEDVSTCARTPPTDTSIPDLINVHTVRVLRSIEAQIRLLALPARPFSHTPFTTCMISEGTLALLSACSFLLKGKELAIARDQIRMTIGCLRSLGEIWPRTARNLKEIQFIARHVFGLDSNGTSSENPKPNEVPCLLGGQGEMSDGCETRTSSIDVLSAVSAADDVYDYYNIDDLAPELSWWTTDRSVETLYPAKDM